MHLEEYCCNMSKRLGLTVLVNKYGQYPEEEELQV
jgi:hypothetical protein